ncbi:MAG: ATP-dependent DNA helicase RecQ, partial [Ignavibacteriae bacterium]|nr:ATP-dependent DNA helicase RecQ [Ignavibacteriota bacterium]
PKTNAKESYKYLLTILHQHKNESGIIYCFSRKATESLARKLRDDGFRSLPYHAGLDSETRTLHQEKFIRDDVEIVVATIAFGMGINKSNVRYVIHYNLPRNLEGYYQETGRAGRDGLPSECILFYSYGDKIKIEHFIDEKEDAREREIARNKLQAIIDFCESKECRRKILLEYFGEQFEEDGCEACDNCLAPKESFDGTIVAQKILSCIARIGERFGAQYVVDVLRGSESQRILSNKHNVLSTYGIGKEYSSKQWLKFIRELVQLKFLEREEQYSTLKLNDRSRDILFRKEKVLLTKPTKEDSLVQVAATTDEHFDTQLFEQLRALRKKLADTEHVPPYVIFHDTTLKEMATVFPTDELHLRTITGIGERKLKKYGKQFLDVIKDYVSRKDKQSLSLENKSPINAIVSKTYTVDEVRKNLPRAYENWSAEEDQNLKAQFLSGKTVNELTHHLQRGRGAIKSRLRKLGLT